MMVLGLDRPIEIKIAEECGETEQAFELIAANDRVRGYEVDDTKAFRFTSFHILPDTVTLVAKHGDHVVATFSLVPDTMLLGLPMESIFGDEVAELRRRRHRMAEAIGLADRGSEFGNSSGSFRR